MWHSRRRFCLGVAVDSRWWEKLLQDCGNAMALAHGRQIHARMVDEKLDRGTFLGSSIVQMYVKCGEFLEARQALHRILEQTPLPWTIAIGAFAQSGHYSEAIRLFYEMQLQGVAADKMAFLKVLSICGDSSSLKDGKQIHAMVAECGVDCDVPVATALINMYGKCRDLERAEMTFEKFDGSHMFPWCALLGAYANSQNDAVKALGVYRRMQLEGIPLDEVTMVLCLRACGSADVLAEGYMVHAHIRESGMQKDLILCNALINMYGKCGSPGEALQVFSSMQATNVISWTSIIGALAPREEFAGQCFLLFRKMQLQGVAPNMVTFVNLLGTSLRIHEGRLLHTLLLEMGLDTQSMILGNSLVDMYCKCGFMEEAEEVWNRLHKRDIISWNILINGYSQLGQCDRLMHQFFRLHQEGLLPTKVTYIAMLGAFSSEEYLQEGRLVHLSAIDSRVDKDELINNCLLNMYSKCGGMGDVRRIFSKISERSCSTWNAILSAHVRCNELDQAMTTYRQMKLEGVKPDQITLVVMLTACTGPESLAEGKVLHKWIVEQAEMDTLITRNTLIAMYARCGSLRNAVQIFDSIASRDKVSWSSLISAYVQHKRYAEAFLSLRKMKLEGVRPNELTYMSMLEACQSPEDARFLQQSIHESGLSQLVSLSNGLIVTQGRCGNLQEARLIFDTTPDRDVVSWNTIILAYVQQEQHKKALELFWAMDVPPVNITYMAALTACASLSNLSQGKRVHSRMTEQGVDLYEDSQLASAVVNMYGKCGNLEEARTIFEGMQSWDLISWTNLMLAYSQHSDCEQALKIMSRMEQAGVKLDQVVFVSVLSGCDHAGLLEQGCRFFSSMRDDYGIPPTVKHYSCVIDMLARMGHCDAAERLVEKSPVDAQIWMTLLSACKLHGDLERAKRASQRLLQIDPQKSAAYIVLSGAHS